MNVKPSLYLATVHRVRSFVLRQGRLTPGQQRALNELWPLWGIENTQLSFFDWDKLYGPHQKRIIEIGFGDGESLVQMANEQPETAFLGIEVHTPGIGHILQTIEQAKIRNIRLMRADAVEVLNKYIAPNSIDGVQLFFPDPWSKKRHHKRRIVQPEFVSLIATRLRAEGIFWCATDWQEYAEHMLDVLNNEPQLTLHYSHQTTEQEPSSILRPNTKFERRGQQLGHGVWDYQAQKNN
ncbi:MAG: tRNA (guanosine(46)-N7)-methyltransferase TrmB [Pseudomonadota bacterium]